MTEKFIDITNQLPLDKLSSEEVAIVLSGITNISSILPEEQHVVTYGGKIKVLYKAGKREIRKVTISRKYWDSYKSTVLDKFHIAVTPTTESIYGRVVYNLGRELPIPPFKWNDAFQLGRIPEGNTKPKELLSLHPCLFQYKVPITGDSRLDQFRSQNIFRKSFLPLIPLLRQYCTTHLQYDGKTRKKAWALIKTENNFESNWVQLDYFLKVPLSSDSYFVYTQPDAKNLPVYEDDPYWLSSISLSYGYSAYESLSKEDQDLFLLGCEWFNKAVTADDQTDSFLFIMIMLEIFLPNDSKPCTECNQAIYSVNKKFKTYIPEIIGTDWTAEFASILGKLYSMRSNITHNGIAIGQYSANIMPLSVKEDEYLRFAFKLASQFLVSWLLHKYKSQQEEHTVSQDKI